jgi:hypothetical protein
MIKYEFVDKFTGISTDQMIVKNIPDRGIYQVVIP